MRAMYHSTQLSQVPCYALGTKVLARGRIIGRMKSNDSSNVVIANILALMKERGWSNRELSRKSHVSDKMVWKIVNGESVPTTNTIDKIANAFGIESWQLMIPGVRPELLKGNHFNKLYHAYIDTDDDGRRVMETTADYVTSHKKPPSNNGGRGGGNVASGS